MKETILIFQVEDPAMKSSISQALLPFHIRLKKVELSDYRKPLGALVGLPGFEATADNDTEACVPLPAPMMIFAGLTESRLDQVLRQLRSKKIPLPYKAVLTAANQVWTPMQCFMELKREHDSMTSSQK